jgi:hypothetical protein
MDQGGPCRTAKPLTPWRLHRARLPTTLARVLPARSIHLLLGTFSAWGKPLPFVATVLSLCVLARLDFRAAAWLVVPALFPTSQYYYAMFALPVDPLLAAAMAFPLPLVPPLLTIAYTAVRLGVAIHNRRFRTTVRTR